MTHRIAPPHEMPTHPNCCMWMGQLADMLEALNRHEAHGGYLLSLCQEWREYKPEVLRCSAGKFGGLDIDRLPPRVKAHIIPHSHIATFVDALIADVYALYGYPPPEKIEIAEERINQLRQYKIELAQCRERMEIKY